MSESNASDSETKVLFLCTGNSCRSQMAEGWARHLKGDSIEPCSAGIEARGLDPHAVRVMAEAGVDIAAQRSKHIADLKDIDFDLVVTVCDQDGRELPRAAGQNQGHPRRLRRPATPGRRRQDGRGTLGPLPPGAR